MVWGSVIAHQMKWTNELVSRTYVKLLAVSLQWPTGYGVMRVAPGKTRPSQSCASPEWSAPAW